MAGNPRECRRNALECNQLAQNPADPRRRVRWPECGFYRLGRCKRPVHAGGIASPLIRALTSPLIRALGRLVTHCPSTRIEVTKALAASSRTQSELRTLDVS